ncbi:MAG: NAD(P)/FAD-dependent oxidoreductase [Marinicaulis sp.]|nr:NAD(P)/FAD-dependent oxidoreductase [Marinicaulis sp.]
MNDFDVIVIGAGAAGFMCAIEAGRRGRRVLLLDHSDKPAEKIRISGGGRCNFTNIRTAPENFLSQNTHFAKSALSRYTPSDFIAKVDAHNIAYHEKTLGQLFCDTSSKQIIDMLALEAREAGVTLRLSASVDEIKDDGAEFHLTTNEKPLRAVSLVIATGGKSIPAMGASDFAYRIAQQYGLKVTETRPALVPLTFANNLLDATKPLAGISADAEVACGKTRFREALLFTHRGLSGPSILQISSYWREGDEITINLAPDIDVGGALRNARDKTGAVGASNALAALLPKRLAEAVAANVGANGKIGEYSKMKIDALAGAVTHWRVKPVGSEGYRTAEVTLGGIDTNELSSKTMEAKTRPGLYFIGEAVDVTGWLGGYNFQWAWSSGWAAGNAV